MTGSVMSAVDLAVRTGRRELLVRRRPDRWVRRRHRDALEGGRGDREDRRASDTADGGADAAVPTATPWARPVVAPIVAVPGVADAQLTEPVRSAVELSEYVPVAVNCWFVPAAIDGLAGVTAMLCRVADPTPAIVRTAVVAP